MHNVLLIIIIIIVDYPLSYGLHAVALDLVIRVTKIVFQSELTIIIRSLHHTLTINELMKN